MLSSDNLKIALPSTEELPCSDDTAVDNEDQNFLPNILLFLLNSIWSERTDWYFGVRGRFRYREVDFPKCPDSTLRIMDTHIVDAP